jgi:S1-C subfamily serine protease
MNDNPTRDQVRIDSDQGLKSSYAPVIERVAPNVVKVFVRSSAPKTQLSLPNLDFFRRFFGEGQLNQATMLFPEIKNIKPRSDIPRSV